MRSLLLVILLLLTNITVFGQTATSSDNVIDEVIWIVGDEPILKSDVEAVRLESQSQGVKWSGNPDCSIPENLAVQKLFLHQAAIDSIEVTESEVSLGIEDQINRWIEYAGSKEKLEEYKKASISQLRSELHDDYRNNLLVQRMKEKIVKDITVTPAEVRRYFKNLPTDSLPYVPTEVEVQIITRTPKIEEEEINRVKNLLREYTDRINKGETSFSTLATLYSEDPVSARRGGELDYVGRGNLDPAFAEAAFNLTDPKKVSKIVESEYGYHIIQLIDKRGDKIKVRHILLKPRVSDEAIAKASACLDSIRTDICDGKITFDEAATYASDDKNTRSNHGLMTNRTGDYQEIITSKFKMQDLPSDMGRVVDTLKIGEISKPFEMTNNSGKEVCVIAKLKNRIDGHKASVTEDYQVLKDVVLNKRRAETLHQWVVDKLKTTYVKINDRYKDCKFEYQGWIK